MEPTRLTLFAEVDDPKLARRFRAALKREQRSMKAVLMLAVADYVTKSEATAEPPAPTQPAPAETAVIAGA